VKIAKFDGAWSATEFDWADNEVEEDALRRAGFS
jgi:hypothetical protein